MNDLRSRIQFAEQATRLARDDIDVWRRCLRGAVRRTVSSPAALLSGTVVGFALGRYRGPQSLEKPLAEKMQRLMHLGGMLGGWSLGYDVIAAALRPRTPPQV